MLHAGLDLSRRRLDYCLLDERGERVEVGAAPPDGDGLRGFAPPGASPSRSGARCSAAIESMNGARFVHDTLERGGLAGRGRRRPEGQGAGAVGVQDRPHRRLGAGRALAPRPGAGDLAAALRAARRARAGALAPVPGAQALARSSTASTRSCWPSGTPARSPTCSARRGPRAARSAWSSPSPWRGGVLAALAMIDDLDRQIAGIDRELRALGADHRYVPLLMSVPGIAWVLGYTIAAEIGDIGRFASPRSWPATPACARASTSRAHRPARARSPTPARSTCAGR